MTEKVGKSKRPPFLDCNTSGVTEDTFIDIKDTDRSHLKSVWRSAPQNQVKQSACYGNAINSLKSEQLL